MILVVAYNHINYLCIYQHLAADGANLHVFCTNKHLSADQVNPYIEQLIENFILDVKFKLHVVSTKSTVLYYTVLYIGHRTLAQQALTVNLLQVGKMMLIFAVNGRY